MKKFISLTIFSLAALVATAQVSLDARLGANVSGITNSGANMKLGIKAGAGINYAFSDKLAVRPMLFYTSKGISEGSNTMGFFPDKTMELNYLQVPVLASYTFKANDNLSFAVNAGPYAAYRISKQPSNSAVKYKSFDAGINAGVDVIFHKHFVAGVDAEYGLTSLSSSSAANLRNICYSLMVGYRF